MKKTVTALITVTVALALVVLLIYGVVSKSDEASIDQAVSNGEKVAAPQLPLEELGTGKEVELSKYRGKTVVLNFWASWCDPCRAEAKDLVEINKELTTKGTGLVVGINFRDATSDAEKFIKEFSITYPNLRDNEGRLAELYGTNRLPETFVIDPDGKVVALHRGQIDQEWIDQELKPLIEGKDSDGK